MSGLRVLASLRVMVAAYVPEVGPLSAPMFAVGAVVSAALPRVRV